MVSTFLILLLT